MAKAILRVNPGSVGGAAGGGNAERRRKRPARRCRNVKYEDVYLRAYETPTELRARLGRYFEFYNTRRGHSALDRRTPDAVYFDQANPELAA